MKARIALYAGTYQRDQDGAVRTLEQLARSATAAGYELGVWSPLHSPIQEPGIHRFPVPSLPLPAYPDYHVGFPLGLTRQLDQFAPKVIHVSCPDIVGHFFIFYAKRRGIPVMSSYHTHFTTYLKYYSVGLFESLLWWTLVQFYNRCRKVFVPTDIIRNELQARGIGNLDIWARGIDLTMFSPERRCQQWRQSLGFSEDQTVLLFCGRLVWYKDLEVYAQVYNILEARHPGRFGYLLVGKGPIREALARRMCRAVFTDHLDGEDLSRAFASSDILLFPSTTETFGNVILEAMASGVVPVVSDQGGCQELVDKAAAGAVIPAGDVEGFAQAVEHYKDSARDYREHRQKGLDFALKQSWPAVNQQILNCYEELLF